MMKAFIALLILAFAGIAFANGGGMMSDEQMGQMMQRMMGSDTTTGDCNMTDHDFEELGDSMMGMMMDGHDGPHHEAFERAMDADALEQMHITMGKQAMGCLNQSTYTATSMGMMMYMMPAMMQAYQPSNQAFAGVTWDQLSFIAIVLGFLGTWAILWVKLSPQK